MYTKSKEIAFMRSWHLLFLVFFSCLSIMESSPTDRSALKSISDDDIDLFAKLLRHDPYLQHKIYRERKTLLHYAVGYGREEHVKVLCQYKSLPINEQDIFGNTALHYALAKEQPGIVNRLLERGALREIKNNYGCTPINSGISILETYLTYPVRYEHGNYPNNSGQEYLETFKSRMGILYAQVRFCRGDNFDVVNNIPFKMVLSSLVDNCQDYKNQLLSYGVHHSDPLCIRLSKVINLARAILLIIS